MAPADGAGGACWAMLRAEAMVCAAETRTAPQPLQQARVCRGIHQRGRREARLIVRATARNMFTVPVTPVKVKIRN
jgi:hypothetical protein